LFDISPITACTRPFAVDAHCDTHVCASTHVRSLACLRARESTRTDTPNQTISIQGNNCGHERVRLWVKLRYGAHSARPAPQKYRRSVVVWGNADRPPSLWRWPLSSHTGDQRGTRRGTYRISPMCTLNCFCV